MRGTASGVELPAGITKNKKASLVRMPLYQKSAIFSWVAARLLPVHCRHQLFH